MVLKISRDEQISAVDVIDALRAEMDQAMIDLAAGSARDYAEYRDACGFLRGLKQASFVIDCILHPVPNPKQNGES